MAFIEVPLGNTAIPEAVPEGPYPLRITDAQEYQKEGSPSKSIQVIIEVLDHPGAANVFHYCALPSEGDEEKKANNKMVMLLRFLDLFGIPYDDGGFNVEDFFGAEATAFLTQEEWEGVPRNKLTFKTVK